MDIIHTIGRRKTSVARLYVNKERGKLQLIIKSIQNISQPPAYSIK